MEQDGARDEKKLEATNSSPTYISPPRRSSFASKKARPGHQPQLKAVFFTCALHAALQTRAITSQVEDGARVRLGDILRGPIHVHGQSNMCRMYMRFKVKCQAHYMNVYESI